MEETIISSVFDDLELKKYSFHEKLKTFRFKGAFIMYFNTIEYIQAFLENSSEGSIFPVTYPATYFIKTGRLFSQGFEDIVQKILGYDPEKEFIFIIQFKDEKDLVKMYYRKFVVFPVNQERRVNLINVEFQNRCDLCGKVTNLKCELCLKVFYCSFECSAKDRGYHKQFCL